MDNYEVNMEEILGKLRNDLILCQSKGKGYGILLTYDEARTIYNALCNQKATEQKKMQDSENNT